MSFASWSANVEDFEYDADGEPEKRLKKAKRTIEGLSIQIGFPVFSYTSMDPYLASIQPLIKKHRPAVLDDSINGFPLS